VLPEGSKEAMAVIERRMHNVVRLPMSHGETIQVMKYQQNQSYGNHHDYFEAVSSADTEPSCHNEYERAPHD
jgi:hypothetical protein